MDEESLKRWGCGFDRSRNEVCGTHASSDACSNGSQFASCYCFKLGLKQYHCQQIKVCEMVNQSLLSHYPFANGDIHLRPPGWLRLAMENLAEFAECQPNANVFIIKQV